jgi:hypothetical protein
MGRFVFVSFSVCGGSLAIEFFRPGLSIDNLSIDKKFCRRCRKSDVDRQPGRKNSLSIDVDRCRSTTFVDRQAGTEKLYSRLWQDVSRKSRAARRGAPPARHRCFMLIPIPFESQYSSTMTFSRFFLSKHDRGTPGPPPHPWLLTASPPLPRPSPAFLSADELHVVDFNPVLEILNLSFSQLKHRAVNCSSMPVGAVMLRHFLKDRLSRFYLACDSLAC